MMTANTIRLLGAALLLIGVVKAWTHSQSFGLLRMPSCLGGDILVRIDAPLWHQFHCWGCYVALLGLAVLLLPIAQKRFAAVM